MSKKKVMEISKALLETIGKMVTNEIDYAYRRGLAEGHTSGFRDGVAQAKQAVRKAKQAVVRR